MSRVLCSNGCCFECEQCSRKPGSPTLCADCLRRRSECSSRRESRDADSTQVGGTHYKDAAKGGEQHWTMMWRLYREQWFIGNITKYVLRYRRKDGIKDLRKAQHYLTKLLELEEADAEKNILSSMTTREASEGKDTTDYHEEVCRQSPDTEHQWLATNTVGTAKCFHCGTLKRTVDPSLIHAVDGNVSLCGIQVGNMNCTVYRPYVNCPRCKEKFK